MQTTSRLFTPVEDDERIMCDCDDDACYKAIEAIDNVLIVYEDVSDPRGDCILIDLPDGYAFCQSVDAPMPNWSQAPEWANWWAVNADLEAFWYAFKPFPLTNLKDACWQWSDGDEFKRIGYAGEAALPIGIDWRTTLQQRPQASA